ncbi:MAG: hydrogenase expression/formation C-terminal domain-containing protein [Pseudomonadota bacterium]
MRKNPMLWDEEGPQGVLAPFEGEDSVDAALDDGLSNLLGLSGNPMGMPGEVKSLQDASPAVLEMLDVIQARLVAAAVDGKAWKRRLNFLSKEERAVLYDALGSGEVSVVISAGTAEEGEVQISETVLPGVWIGRAADADGVVRSEWVEVADAPHALRDAAIMRPRADLPLDKLSAPRGAMNVMGVLSEVRERACQWEPNIPNHVVNFTLFPMTEADTSFLTKVLGEVGVRITSGGYGTARVIMTALRNVYAVQYLNGLGAVILDTLEVGDIPSAVLASKEDFEDSAGRLEEIRGAYGA